MITLLSLICLGFFLGMRHATDADHVIAVTTIVSRQRAVRGAALIGALWGFGHTLTILIVGSAIVVFGFVISPRMGLSMELCVALMLVLLGAWNLRAFRQTLLSFLSRNQASETKSGNATSPHVDEIQTGLDSRFANLRTYQMLRPFVVGVVHGLAGSAAVALLVVPMIHSVYWAAAYLAVFGLGTIAGMMAITAAIAWPFSSCLGGSPTLHQRLGLASGFVSLAFGVLMIYQIGFVEGLFLK